MPVLFKNNAFSTLASGISDVATSLTVTSGHGARFPNPVAPDYFYATLIDTSNNLEIVKCTARSTDVLTIVRERESTTGRAFSAADRIELRITAAGLLELGNWIKGADVASATALPILTSGNYFDVTGTATVTSINSVGVTPGAVIKLHFDGALTLTHHTTNLVLPGADNILTAAGDEAEFVEYASGDYRLVSYVRASGLYAFLAEDQTWEGGQKIVWSNEGNTGTSSIVPEAVGSNFKKWSVTGGFTLNDPTAGESVMLLKFVNDGAGPHTPVFHGDLNEMGGSGTWATGNAAVNFVAIIREGTVTHYKILPGT